MKKDITNELKGAKLPVVTNCFGTSQACSRIVSESFGNYCSVYYNPSAKWRYGDCPMADEHLRTKIESTKEKIRIGQQKQKKGK